MTNYSLWETDSGNVIGEFDSEAAALLAVTEAAQLHGPTYVDSFALIGYEHGKPVGVASGAHLLKLARTRYQAASA